MWMFFGEGPCLVARFKLSAYSGCMGLYIFFAVTSSWCIDTCKICNIFRGRLGGSKTYLRNVRSIPGVPQLTEITTDFIDLTMSWPYLLKTVMTCLHTSYGSRRAIRDLCTPGLMVDRNNRHSNLAFSVFLIPTYPNISQQFPHVATRCSTEGGLMTKTGDFQNNFAKVNPLNMFERRFLFSFKWQAPANAARSVLLTPTNVAKHYCWVLISMTPPFSPNNWRGVDNIELFWVPGFAEPSIMNSSKDFNPYHLRSVQLPF